MSVGRLVIVTWIDAETVTVPDDVEDIDELDVKLFSED